MRASLAALAAVLSLPAASWGRQEPSYPASVTETEFLTFDGAELPAVRALREETALARAETIAVRALGNPRLAASREAPASGTEQVDLTLAWEPPRPGRRRLAIAASEAGLAAAESRLEAERLGVHLAMREAFARWALAARRSEILAAVDEHFDSLALFERRRAASGEVSGLDARRVETAAAEVAGELVRSRAELLRARAAALAWRPDLAADLRPVVPRLPPPPAARSIHPEVAALEADVERARLERDAAGTVVQLPEIVAGWQRQRSELGVVAEGPVVGIEWPLPIWPARQSGRARAEARMEALQARLELARRRVTAGMEGALAAYVVLREGALAAAAAADEAEPMLAAASASFEMGEATVTVLLESARLASAAFLQALDLHGEALEAHRELERSAGGALEARAGDGQEPSRPGDHDLPGGAPPTSPQRGAP